MFASLVDKVRRVCVCMHVCVLACGGMEVGELGINTESMKKALD